MKVLHAEDLASHNGSESCGVIRKGAGEVSRGKCTDSVSSREELFIQGANAVEKRSHMVWCVTASTTAALPDHGELAL